MNVFGDRYGRKRLQTWRGGRGGSLIGLLRGRACVFFKVLGTLKTRHVSNNRLFLPPLLLLVVCLVYYTFYYTHIVTIIVVPSP